MILRWLKMEGTVLSSVRMKTNCIDWFPGVLVVLPPYCWCSANVLRPFCRSPTCRNSIRCSLRVLSQENQKPQRGGGGIAPHIDSLRSNKPSIFVSLVGRGAGDHVTIGETADRREERGDKEDPVLLHAHMHTHVHTHVHTHRVLTESLLNNSCCSALRCSCSLLCR